MTPLFYGILGAFLGACFTVLLLSLFRVSGDQR